MVLYWEYIVYDTALRYWVVHLFGSFTEPIPGLFAVFSVPGRWTSSKRSRISLVREHVALMSVRKSTPVHRSCTFQATFLRPAGRGSQTLAQPGREEGTSTTPGFGFPGDDAGCVILRADNVVLYLWDKLSRRSGEEAGIGIQGASCRNVGMQRLGSFMTRVSSRTTAWRHTQDAFHP